MNKITETVGENKAPERIDVFTSEIAAVTRSRAAALIADGCVTVNGKKGKVGGYRHRNGARACRL